MHACGLNNTDVNTRTGWYSKAVTQATTGGALVQLAKRRGGTIVALASEEKHEHMSVLPVDHLLPRAPLGLKSAHFI